jgi:hypothetical protein
MPLAFHTLMINMYEKYDDTSIGIRQLFMDKKYYMLRDVNWEPLAFYTWYYTCKNIR